ncbi:phosphodiester glycosidase family protein [Clostridium estertheticum]|uniref:M56 family metallopeptidase n=1 Tax=Clostridium estertheticum TaxID=238834 RepID=UPI001CF2EBB4|nr:M56 family metallopeptidase [Clostridium estertheticum]MCB2305546.1 phosphodiester glycosidase family protein [Clostridium estertheticum]MCB2343985.1 phosphodiester glycosidase family protein [Clostridium estertheticum]MCB2348901.1 phosphodiester glycosidase family protein [Clostridium estertheticum]WAG46219.1 phosphodiester glycosidase family protein [Clostridium estertheticum]
MLFLVSIFKWVLYSTALASILSLIVLLFKLLLKNKLGVRWHYAIWLIIVIRLLIPYGLQSSLSLFNLIEFGSKQVTQVTYTQNLKINKIVNTNKTNTDVTQGVIKSILPSNTYNTDQSPLYLQLLSSIWLFVVIIIGVYTIVMTIKLKAKFKNGHVCDNEEVMLLLSQCKDKLNIKSIIKVINTNEIKTPCIYGFIKPKLLLPIGIENYVDKTELEFIILHELAHVKRQDIIVSCITGVLQIIHWFNPIIWYSFYRMSNDKELACDALALSHVKCENYINYGKTIIKLLESYKKAPQVYGMSYIINNKSQIKRRITMISLFKKNSYKWSIIPIVTLTLMGGIMLTNAKNKPVLAGNKNKQTSKSITTLSNNSKTNIERYNISNGLKFTGYALIIKDPTKLKVGFSNKLGKDGELTSQIAQDNGAIAAINAGGFTDPDKKTSPSGLIMHDGKVIFNDIADNNIKGDIVAFTNKGTLLVGKYSLNELNKLNTTEAVSFGPALIVNGKPTITEGDGGWGIAPRTVIGQKKDGSVILLTIDGRSVKSLGATLLDVQNILLQYGAVYASNLDGGSSSTMYYKGKVINNPCDISGERKVVSTFMVLP